MIMTRLTPWLWSSALYATYIGRAAAAATSTTSALPSWFNGYYIHLDGGATLTDTISCETTSGFSTSGTYANCCGSGGKCPMPTKCLDHTVYMDDDTYYGCGTSSECATMTVYATYPFGEPFVKNVFCWPNWEANTVYRELPSPTATTAATSLSASAGSTANQATASATSTDSSSDSDSSQPENKGWIAGAVVGPVAGLALGAFGVWVGYRKMKKAREMEAQTAMAPQYAQYPAEMQSQPVFMQPHVELDSSTVHQKP